MKLARALPALALVATLPLTGCQTYGEYGLTHKLWSDPGFTDYYEPAGTAGMKSFQRPPGARLLVTYDERRENDSSLRRRAFFLPDSTKALAAQRKPGFTSPKPDAGWAEIPVIAAGQPPPTAPLYLRLATDNKSFTIVRDGVVEGPYQLPTYVDRSSTAFRASDSRNSPWWWSAWAVNCVPGRSCRPWRRRSGSGAPGAGGGRL